MWRPAWPRHWAPGCREPLDGQPDLRTDQHRVHRLVDPQPADVELDYLYLDGTCFRYHPGARAEPVLVAYGITTTGGPVFLGLAPAASEGHDPWVDFLADLTNRGLRSPVLVISDGAPGLVSAAEHHLPSRPAATLSGPPRPQRARQGPSPRPSRGQGRVLADLRQHRAARGQAAVGGGHPPRGSVHRPLRAEPIQPRWPA
jgi:hypothetical protein